MLAGVLAHFVRRDRAKQVVGSRASAQEEEDPGALKVGQVRQFIQEPGLLSESLLQVGGHEVGTANRSAQDLQTLLDRGPVSAPDLGAQLSHPRRGGATATAVHPTLAEVAIYVRGSPNSGRGQVESLARVLTSRADIDVIKESENSVFRSQGGGGLDESRVLSEAEQGGGEGVALLHSFALGDVVDGAAVVAPQVGALVAIPLSDERDQRGQLGVAQELLEEAGSRHVVERAHSIDGDQHSVRVVVRHGPESHGGAVRAGPRGQSELVRGSSSSELLRVLLSYSSRDQPSEHVSRRDASDPSSWLLQSGQFAESHGLDHWLGNPGARESGGGVAEQLHRSFVVEERLQVLGFGAGRPGSSSSPRGPETLEEAFAVQPGPGQGVVHSSGKGAAQLRRSSGRVLQVGQSLRAPRSSGGGREDLPGSGRVSSLNQGTRMVSLLFSLLLAALLPPGSRLWRALVGFPKQGDPVSLVEPARTLLQLGSPFVLFGGWPRQQEARSEQEEGPPLLGGVSVAGLVPSAQSAEGRGVGGAETTPQEMGHGLESRDKLAELPLDIDSQEGLPGFFARARATVQGGHQLVSVAAAVAAQASALRLFGLPVCRLRSLQESSVVLVPSGLLRLSPRWARSWGRLLRLLLLRPRLWHRHIRWLLRGAASVSVGAGLKFPDEAQPRVHQQEGVLVSPVDVPRSVRGVGNGLADRFGESDIAEPSRYTDTEVAKVLPGDRWQSPHGGHSVGPPGSGRRVGPPSSSVSRGEAASGVEEERDVEPRVEAWVEALGARRGPALENSAG